ncbi:Uncharacterised protein [Segatella copri]|nr:Uncharacterised protein [Segatella copri]
MLCKVVGDVHSQHLCPEIAVIACSITAAPYVVEV